MAYLTENFMRSTDDTATLNTACNANQIQRQQPGCSLDTNLKMAQHPRLPTLDTDRIRNRNSQRKIKTDQPREWQRVVKRHLDLISEAATGLQTLLDSHIKLNRTVKSLDLTHKLQQAHNRVDTWLQGLHQACIRAHTKMITDKEKSDNRTKDKSGSLLHALREWQLLSKIPEGQEWDDSITGVCHLREVIRSSGFVTGPAVIKHTQWCNSNFRHVIL